jgi:hypothetical protein
MGVLRNLGEILATAASFLCFRPVVPDLKRLRFGYIATGLVFAWLAGVGRHLEDDRAELWQRLGLGSVAYVVAMALFLWLVLWPLRPKNWSFTTVLVFVGMTAPPAWLYAIPVKHLYSFATASTWRELSLLIVSIWRVSLLAVFLKRAAGLRGGEIAIAVLVPLAVIVVVLTELNLDHIVLHWMMGRTYDYERSFNDAAYGITILLAFPAMMFSPILLIAYVLLVFWRWRPTKANWTRAE